MANVTFSPVFGKRIRVTRLDSCGVPPAAAVPDAFLATSGFVTVSLSAEVEDGNEIIVRNAAGQICINERMSSNFKRFNVEIAFCGVNPALLAMVTNAEAYQGSGTDVIGITVPEGALNKAFALELWTGMAGQACASGADEASGYMLLPYVGAGVLGDLEIGGEDAINFSMTGAYTKGGNVWGVGPYDVVFDDADAPSPLPTALDSMDHLLLVSTGLALPPDADDMQPMPA